MDQRKYPVGQKTFPSFDMSKSTCNESDGDQETVSEMNNSYKLNTSCQHNDAQEHQRCNLQLVEADADFASAKCLGFSARYCFFCNNRKECEALMRTSSRDIQCSPYGPEASGDQNVDENCITPFANATMKPFGKSYQSKSHFLQRSLRSYEGCSCIWNENDGNKESLSEINNFSKLSLGHQKKDEKEIQPLSLKPLTVAAELTSAKCLDGNNGDGLFCDNRKEFENKERTRTQDILCSSDDQDLKGDQKVYRNDVTPVNATTEQFGDTFKNLRKQKHWCPYCLKVFPTPSKHQRHILVHTREESFMCGSCGQRFRQKAHLKRHRRVYSERTFICDQCGTEFPLKCALEAHLREERENKHFVCDFCKKKFSSKRLLMEHRRSHGRERPYKCRICGKDYVYGKGLRRHEKIHQ